MSKTIYIGGRLESKEKGNVVTGANAILDDTKGKKQNVINKETDDELARLEQSKQDNLTFDNAPTEDSTNPVTSGGVYTAEKALSDAIEAILLLIPSAATALNKLVDTNTMNSSISTATATFRGTYNAVSDLGLTYQATHAQIEAALDALGLTADNNDFAFVQIPVSDQSQDIAKTERFKFNGTNWLYEYDLNTSGFTAAQWGAINSTITLALVQKLAALPTNAELLQALGLKQDVLTFDNAPTKDSNNPVKSGGIKNAIDTAVGDEATDRENADTALSGLIGDEQTRAEGVEGGLNTRLGAVEGSVTTIQGVIPSGATSSNKLVDGDSMTTYIGTIIDNMDATFNLTSTDGHVTLAITQINGVITSVQLTTSDIASAAALNLKASQADLTTLAGRVTTAEGNITSLTGRMTTAESDIDTLTDLYNALQQSAPQVIQPTDTWPVANPSTTVIYRVIDRVNTPPEYYSDYMWNGTSMVLMATYNNAIDDVPTAGSNNLVKSGGVESSFSKKFPINETVPETDFAIIDKDNNAVLIVDKGHVMSKNFNSKDAIPAQDSFAGDIVFVDKNGKIGLMVKGGHIQTKNFNSEDVAIKSLQGLKLSIMGDSISTFDGKLVPNPIGLWSYYPNGDVLSWEDTYWGRLIVNDGMSLDSNCASNGSLVSGSDDFAMCSDARLDLLGDPDVIIFYGGTNDIATNKAIGTFDYIDYSGKANYFKPAYAYCLQQMKIKYPKAIIVCVLLPDFSGTNNRGTENVYPLMNQGIPTFEYNKVIKELALAYDCILCDIGSSAPYFNRANYYIHDGDGSYVHPNKARMSKIYEVVKKSIINKF